VNDKNKHIRQRPDDEYPNPGVPADGAWAGMQDMLDREMPLSEADVSSRNGNFNWAKAIKLLSVTCLTFAGLVYLILSKKPANLDNKMKSETLKEERNEPALDHRKNTFENSSKTHLGVVKPTSISNIIEQKSSEKPIIRRIQSDSLPLQGHNQINSESGLNQKGRALKKEGVSNSNESKKLLAGQSAVRLEGELSSGTKRTPGVKSERTNNVSKVVKTLDLPNQDQSKTSSIIPIGAHRNNRTDANSQWVVTGENSQAKLANQKKETFSGVQNNISTPSESGLKITPEKRFYPISMLFGRNMSSLNHLEQTLKTIRIQSTGPVSKQPKKMGKQNILEDIHGGLLWNISVPFSGYDSYFRGTNNTNFQVSGVSNEFYKVLFPGLWIAKTLKNGDEIVIKMKPYNQYFGSGNRSDSSRVRESDTTGNYFTITRRLLKSSGPNLGVQYNHAITRGWSVGIGANMQWQPKALLGNEVKSSRRNSVVDYVPFVSLVQSTDTSNYLKPSFIAANIELLYSWKKLQLGAGFGIPVTSMIGTRYRSLRPISGQVTFRWKLK